MIYTVLHHSFIFFKKYKKPPRLSLISIFSVGEGLKLCLEKDKKLADFFFKFKNYTRLFTAARTPNFSKKKSCYSFSVVRGPLMYRNERKKTRA
jgi:hypothetical protein